MLGFLSISLATPPSAPAAAAADFTLGGTFVVGVRRPAAFKKDSLRSVGFIAHADCPVCLPVGVVVVVVCTFLYTVKVVVGRCLREAVAVSFCWRTPDPEVVLVVPAGVEKKKNYKGERPPQKRIF